MVTPLLYMGNYFKNGVIPVQHDVLQRPAPTSLLGFPEYPFVPTVVPCGEQASHLTTPHRGGQVAPVEGAICTPTRLKLMW